MGLFQVFADKKNYNSKKKDIDFFSGGFNLF